MVGLPDGKKTLRICVTVYTQYRCVTDGQTDRQTSCHGIVRAMYTRRALMIRFTSTKDQKYPVSVERDMACTKDFLADNAIQLG